MCGIAGICNLRGAPADRAILAAMGEAIAHRGPDDDGVHLDRNVGFAHRRLAVIDLSAAAAQPLKNETGDVVLNYNGEIYEFARLRAELEQLGHRFRSRTDSEVVVHGYEEWGADVVRHLDGMFAFAVWDATRRRLLLARDRFGVKPLYWWCRNGLFAFGSEVKALLAHPRISASVSHEALAEYFTFQNVLSDRTLFEGVRMLPPGCTLVLDADGGEPRVERYWDVPHGDAIDLPDGDLADLVHDAVAAAVERQLVSDVPVGAYLSGGMDSGSIVSVAVHRLPRLATFTAGFDTSSVSGLEFGFDERPQAEALANQFKTEHYEVVLHAGDMEWVLPELVWHLEDLRVGQSYPNYYVARLASKFVRVVMSGAGGDELFGGYPWRYFRGDANSAAEFFHAYYGRWQRLVPDADRSELFNDETWRAASHYEPFEAFRSVFAEWRGDLSSPEDFVEASLYFEQKTFLHGLLVVEDKLSMAHSLETRVPFLDNQLVDLAVRLPVRAKLRDLRQPPGIDENLPGKRRLYELETSDGKVALREAMSRLLPAEVRNRAKQGFSAPDASWFRGESIHYVNRLLRDPRARVYEFLSPAYVARALDDHTSGRVNRRLFIWSLLSFEWWCRCFLDREVPADVAAVRALAQDVV